MKCLFGIKNFSLITKFGEVSQSQKWGIPKFGMGKEFKGINNPPKGQKLKNLKVQGAR